ncbi:MAG: uncharacterized protein JWR62_2521 [Modestobacter sp.]|jgi:hypothetical protein|nr:uncharacterized protein [Modestobacter sp.]HEV7871952.1 hypothetical protein [Modestobacter sp.]
MTNVVGLPVGTDAAAPGGVLHAVEGGAGRAARGTHEPVQALCGERVRVVGAEEIPADAGLCRLCEGTAWR